MLPCCVDSRSHLVGVVARLDDDARYALMCGAMASEFSAQARVCRWLNVGGTVVCR